MHRENFEILNLLTSSRVARVCVILLGIIATQVILYGPALLGRRIMLPLDVLAQPTLYIPRTPEIARIPSLDPAITDLVIPHETSRRFVHEEVSAGRLPQWMPYQFCGSPNIWPWYSPFLVLAWSTASPVIWAWVHLLEAIVAGFGAYVFIRRVLGVGFWASAVPTWCYPLTGFFVFWQGNPTGSSVFWFPWLVFAVDRAVRTPRAVTVIGLASATALVLISGHADVAGQCLIVSALYGVWCLIDAHRSRWRHPAFRKAMFCVGAGWLLGFSLAAPYLLPVLEYSQTGARMARRSGGEEERPPGNLSALPKLLAPDMHGSTRNNSLWLGSINQIESMSAAYCGVLTILLLAPLAWCNRRLLSFNIACAVFIVLGLAWCLGLPGFVALLRLPVANMMSHNRLVFVASFFFLCQAAIGFEQLQQPAFERRRWFIPAAIMVASFFFWCAHRAIVLPEPIGTQLAAAVAAGNQAGWVRNADDVAQVKAWFGRAYAVPALLCLLAVAGWLLLFFGRPWHRTILAALGLICVGDLIWFAHGRAARGDPALYFPRVPLLAELASAPAGRILGAACLPASLAQACGLRDIRGYDGVDPRRLVELLEGILSPDAFRSRYAWTQWFRPRLLQGMPPDGIKLPPILDMLGVRYVIFRGEPLPPLEPRARSFDYWALVNYSAMPRVFIPRSVEHEPDNRSRLAKLASENFDPRAIAYVETAVNVPPMCRGAAKIDSDIPTRVLVSAQMETPGLVVLGDRWDTGWKAYLDTQPVPILQVNHVLRGIVVPAGAHTIDFRYAPTSFHLGLWLAGAAVAVLAAFMMGERIARRPAGGTTRG